MLTRLLFASARLLRYPRENQLRRFAFRRDRVIGNEPLRRHLCSPAISVEDSINQWSSSHEAIQHASEHGHMYSDADLVLGVQRLVVVGKDGVRSDLTQYQDTNDFIRIVCSRIQRRPSPAAVSMMALAMCYASLSCDVLFQACLGESEGSEYEYLLSVAQKCKQQAIRRTSMWRELANLASHTSMFRNISDAASFLATLPPLPRRGDKEVIDHLCQSLLAAPLPTLSVADLVNFVTFLSAYDSSDSEVILAIKSRAEELTADQVGALCQVVEVQRNIELATAVKHRVSFKSDDLDVHTFIHAFNMVLAHQVLDEKFVQMGLRHLKSCSSDLDLPTFLSLLSSVSALNFQLLPEAEEFLRDVLLPSFVQRSEHLTYREVSDVVFCLRGKKKPGWPYSELIPIVANRLCQLDATEFLDTGVSYLLPRMHNWPEDILFDLCYKVAKRDWPLSSLTSLLATFLKVVPTDLMTLAYCGMKINKDMHLLGMVDLVNLALCLEFLHSKQIEVSVLPVLEKLLNVLHSEDFPLPHYADVVRLSVSFAADKKQEYLDAVAREVRSRHKVLSGQEWVRLLEAWVVKGDCNKDIFLLACTACRQSPEISPSELVSILSAVTKGGIVSRPLMMNFQNTEWGQKLVSSLPSKDLLRFLQCFARLGINAPHLMDHLYKRLNQFLFTDMKARKDGMSVANANIAVCAWCFAVLGNSAEEILGQALYQANAFPKTLTKEDALLLNDLNNFAQNERRELQMAPLDGDALVKVQAAAWRQSGLLASSTRQWLEESGLDNAMLKFAGGEEFLRRNVVANCGYLAHYAVQLDDRDQIVPFADDPGQNTPLPDGKPTYRRQALPDFKLTFCSSKDALIPSAVKQASVDEVGYEEIDMAVDDAADNAVDDAGSESTHLVVSEEGDRQALGPPVRRLAIRILRAEDCVVETDRPRDRAVMDLLQLSAAGWSVSAISMREWESCVTAKDQESFLRKKIFPRDDQN